MADVACLNCGFYPLSEGARYCQQCGYRLEEKQSQPSFQSDETPLWNRLVWPLGTIGFTLLLSWFFMVVLHWPIFILGAFLPLAWKFSKKR